MRARSYLYSKEGNPSYDEFMNYLVRSDSIAKLEFFHGLKNLQGFPEFKNYVAKIHSYFICLKNDMQWNVFFKQWVDKNSIELNYVEIK